jgi:glucans biosynthesis protein
VAGVPAGTGERYPVSARERTCRPPPLTRRRALIGGGASLSLPAILSLASSDAAAQPSGGTFDAGTVRRLARELAQRPFQPAETKLPAELSHLDYDQYRSIRFDPRHALWRGEGLFFQIEFFHRGLYYQQRVDIYQVVNGQAQPIEYSPDLFDFGKAQRPAPADLGFAGFRIHAPFNRSDYYDEICAFVGASYFRAVAKNQGYGLSARGLAIKTADPAGEEFPLFKTFWIEKPPPGSRSIVVHVLLDSESTAGAFRYTIRPGDDTLFDVETALYPRVDIAQPGIAPMTTMFYFDANDRSRADDYRPAVHDSHGLQIWTGRAEQLWRPLANPVNLQFSAFADTNPRGFGLMQRKRAFADYDDLEARYEKRPSLWVEPIGDWGEGAVDLVEIPSSHEIHDNSVAFWRPKAPLQAKQEYTFTYRLHWCWDTPAKSHLARIVDTRSGLTWDQKARLFVIDLVGDALKGLPAEAKLRAEVSGGPGRIQHAVAQPNPETGGWRMSFELDPQGAKLVELRAQLLGEAGPLSEVWLYRWTL